MASAGQSAAQLKKDFENIRKKFNGRYIRLYGACDKKGYYNDIVAAAWDAVVGIHGLVWVSSPVKICTLNRLIKSFQFGFDGGNECEKRRDALFAILKSNPKA